MKNASRVNTFYETMFTTQRQSREPESKSIGVISLEKWRTRKLNCIWKTSTRENMPQEQIGKLKKEELLVQILTGDHLSSNPSLIWLIDALSPDHFKHIRMSTLLVICVVDHHLTSTMFALCFMTVLRRFKVVFVCLFVWWNALLPLQSCRC